MDDARGDGRRLLTERLDAFVERLFSRVKVRVAPDESVIIFDRRSWYTV